MSNQLVSFNDVDDSADTLELIKLGRELEIEKGSLNQRIRSLEDQLNARTRWEIIADTLNRFRVIPRLAVALFGVMSYEIVQFALSQDGAYGNDALAGIVVGAFATSLAAYMNSGDRSK